MKFKGFWKAMFEVDKMQRAFLKEYYIAYWLYSFITAIVALMLMGYLKVEDLIVTYSFVKEWISEKFNIFKKKVTNI